MRFGLCLLLAGSVASCVGCGGAKRFVSTPEAVAALKQAGFRQLVVLSNRRAFVQLARLQGLRRPAASTSLDLDTIVTRRDGLSPFGSLLAVRFPTQAMAERRVVNDQPLLRGNLTAQERSVLPRGFDRTRFRDVRVCNVVVSSYNRARDATLTARFDQAIVLLRQAC